MFDFIFTVLAHIDAFFWRYIGFVLIAAMGCYLTVASRFFQIRGITSILRSFFSFFSYRIKEMSGTHPLKAFLASTGGMLGIGNIVGIVTAVQLGGPGALFWVWIAGFLGSLIKYSEIYLGLKYRIRNHKGGYDGGSVHFLKAAFKLSWIPLCVSVLLCIYGAEIYQFSVLTHALSTTWHFNHLLVVLIALGCILYTITGGIDRIGKICTLLIPLFTLIYLSMCLYVIAQHLPLLPTLFASIFKGAFTGQSALGGFAGSSILLALQQGTSRAIYSTDIGIGYDSIIQSESSTEKYQAQAHLAILGVFFDNAICTLTLLVSLCSGLWCASPVIDPSLMIQKALALHFTGAPLFMSLFLSMLAYTTLISYLYAGLKSARYLHPRHGEKIYLIVGPTFLFGFSFLDQSHALLVMSLSGCLLVSINMAGIFRLRKEIDFSLDKDRTPEIA